jgi:hypothetical protein
MENVGICILYVAISNILQPIEIFYDHLVILLSFGTFFHRFGILYQEKIWQPRPS